MKLKDTCSWDEKLCQPRQHIKSRGITLPTRVCLVKAMVCPVVIYGCEIWTTKKAEWWRIDAFKLWCWRKLSRVLWTARRSVNPIGNQSWISIGRTDAEAEASILWPLDAKNRLEKTLMPGKIEGRSRRSDREWDGWRASPTWWTWVWTSSGSCYRQGGLVCCNLWGCKDLDTSEWLNLATCHSIEYPYHFQGQTTIPALQENKLLLDCNDAWPSQVRHNCRMKR